MRQILISTLLTSLLISPTANAENRSTLHSAATQIKKRSTNKARSGFYLEIKRSYVRAYPGWQKKTITLLRLNGFAAFNGEPNKQISAVYVGPYQSRAVAEDMIPELLSALKPLIDDEKKNDELNNRYLFLVGVVRVI